jgi:hypothetical protein
LTGTGTPDFPVILRHVSDELGFVAAG